MNAHRRNVNKGVADDVQSLKSFAGAVAGDQGMVVAGGQVLAKD